jgi:hypothetical protein
MRQYRNPLCQAPDPESWRGICGITMKLVDERHPLYKPKHYVFLCPRCEAMQAITEDQLSKIVEVR